jgi:hypothetical protein
VQVEEINIIEKSEGPFGDNPPENDLVLLGILGIKDPLRPEVCMDGSVTFLFMSLLNILLWFRSLMPSKIVSKQVLLYVWSLEII